MTVAFLDLLLCLSNLLFSRYVFGDGWVLSLVRQFVTPWTVSCQAPLSMEFSRHKNTGVDCHSLLLGIFLTQGSNLGPLHCRQIIMWATREAHCTDYLSLIFIALIMTDSACLYLQRHRHHNSLNHRNSSSSFYHSGWRMVEGSIFVEIKIKLKLN